MKRFVESSAEALVAVPQGLRVLRHGRDEQGGGVQGPRRQVICDGWTPPQTKGLQDLALLGAWGGCAEPFPGAKFDLEGSLVPSVLQRVSAGPRMGNPLLDHWQRGQSHLALVAKLHPAR
ncbi:hypothetical protein BN1708_012893 [Verticillium longisporum]|uniref:Uncharacterized protein n=1 Tax=Verticillium longisporum TaxID=100787 RepID=A0A0G4LF23_VERLO|nr:hypothetical protein BN1708_012893 [Verticillium longisporum]